MHKETTCIRQQHALDNNMYRETTCIRQQHAQRDSMHRQTKYIDRQHAQTQSHKCHNAEKISIIKTTKTQFTSNMLQRKKNSFFFKNLTVTAGTREFTVNIPKYNKH